LIKTIIKHKAVSVAKRATYVYAHISWQIASFTKPSRFSKAPDFQICKTGIFTPFFNYAIYLLDLKTFKGI
tara:strand:- start:500 stop:712 length:213 start_codon:yes stop_codon:yes gene_type:complete